MRRTIILAAGLGLGLVTLVPATLAGQCEFEIDSDDAMQFDRDTMHVGTDCAEVTVHLTHSGNLGVAQMGHNWVLTRSEDFQDTARAGQAAGLENDYLPSDRSAVIAATDMIGGGEQTNLTFDAARLEEDGEYTFFCSFPGHWGQMRGELRVR